MKHRVLALVAVSVLVTGCSTRPREFTARLSGPPADSSAFEADLAACRTMVSEGRRTGFRDAALMSGSGAVGAAAAGTAAIGTGAIPVGIGMSTTAGVALLALMPLAGVGAAVGVSKAIRAGKEKEIKSAMELCLAEHGHTVDGWDLARKPRNQP